uniref:WD_REPEATS_REGION domain-containing protein n=1 Tax=Ascaris lumbricoides TaxID=6252 RepID=A0A0M3IKD5_ASCLU
MLPGGGVTVKMRAIYDSRTTDRGCTLETLSTGAQLQGKVGRIIPYTARTATGQRDRTAASRLLVRSHTLDGHTRAVLSVSANDATVITGSKGLTFYLHCAKVGRIIPYTARTATGQRDRTAASRLLVRSHTLDGHTRAVLSVSANDTTVITGSKERDFLDIVDRLAKLWDLERGIERCTLDRLAKLWDLERGIERCTLGLHQNNVTCVRLIPNGHLALSVSMSTVRIWDVRTEKCVYVLHSSGLATEGNAIVVLVLFLHSLRSTGCCLDL